MTWSLIGLNLLVFLMEISSDADLMVARYGVTPAAFIGDGAVPGALSPVLTLVTYQFLHGGLLHLLLNMVLVYFFGRAIEDALGRGGLLRVYLLSGVVGGLKGDRPGPKIILVVSQNLFR